MTVTALEPNHLEAFFVSLYERGVRRTTIHARHHALASFFGWLVEETELPASPMADVRALAAALPRPRAVTSDETLRCWVHAVVMRSRMSATRPSSTSSSTPARVVGGARVDITDVVRWLRRAGTDHGAGSR
jgi:site-specific recombinase XerD